MLKSKSQELARKLDHNHFKARDGWLSQWECRFGIKFKKAHSEKDSAEQCKSKKLPNLLQKFCANDIYNLDLMHLFYRAMLDGFIRYKHATLSGSNNAMDYCFNTSGTDKQKLLVIGKRAKPRYFIGICMDS
jgi:hypothetical protein